MAQGVFAEELAIAGQGAEPDLTDFAQDDFAPEQEPVKEPAGFWMVAIYLVNRSYGGPEEGGWWYDAGVRMNHAIDEAGTYGRPMTFWTDTGANEWAKQANRALNDTINKGRREIGSVLSIGVYRAMVWEGFAPDHWPAERPHYE